ncbi:MAG: 4-hydroxy-tetrahydrodipicolinate reductase [Eubacteriaceae bacterium]|nr:4-hydroxy-tetrahydrodipicolinate reductase [Eubacteriaceae bacterium]
MRIILVGSSGTMGRNIINSSRLRGHEIVAGVDRFDIGDHFPVYEHISDIMLPADVVIDFSHPHLLIPTIEYCEKHHLPLIYGTTGIGEDDDDRLFELSRIVPVVRSSNFSFGMCVLKNLLAKATKLLKNNYDIEIIEMHHHNKADAPSGTAHMLFDIINACCDDNLTPVYDRHSKYEKRSQNEVGISSVRGGSIVGEHEVVFAGDDEIIRLSHSAYSKSVFSTGALIAAETIISKENGYYTMDNITDMIMDDMGEL